MPQCIYSSLLTYLLLVPNLDIHQLQLIIDKYILYITDPPERVSINTSSNVKEVYLRKGFGENIFNASAESYSAINCSSVMITWSSSKIGNVLSCHSKGK